MTLRIEDYALIGDCKTAALVGRDGSIDWLCWPRFDSPACFASLLGNADNGRWLIAPKDSPLAARRRYRPGTLVLEAEYQTETGSAAVIDFMLPADGADLLRIVTGRSGRIVFKTELVARLNTPVTACPQVKELSWHAAFGWFITTYCRSAMRKRASYSPVCSRAAMTSVCSRKSSIR
jgi:hypothetical protein